MSNELEWTDLDQAESSIRQNEVGHTPAGDAVPILVTICDELYARDLGDLPRQLGLVHRAARLALTWGALSIATELRLISYLDSEVDVDGIHPPARVLAARRTHARRWLGALQRLERVIDVEFDPDDIPMLHAEPPAGLPAGIAPESVADPDERRRYRTRIDEVRLRAEQYAEQVQARRLIHLVEGDAVRFLSRGFGADRTLRNNLAALLDEYDVGQRRRTMILAATRARGRRPRRS